MRLRHGEERVLVISDTQEPYAHRDALPFVQAVAAKIDPTIVVHIGDEVDHTKLGNYAPDPDMDAAGPELKQARRKLRRWFEAFPDARVCMSNHTDRALRKAFLAGLPRAYLRPVNDWFNAPAGWRWADYHLVDGVQYEHGHAAKGGGVNAARSLAVANRRSTVIGHFHGFAGIAYIANDRELIWGMNVGCLIDPASPAYAYQMRKSATLGCGAVIYGAPQFWPMPLTKSGRRWDGKVRARSQRA